MTIEINAVPVVMPGWVPGELELTPVRGQFAPTGTRRGWWFPLTPPTTIKIKKEDMLAFDPQGLEVAK